MKFIDIMRISLHNMWNNKTRTLLVTLVLLVLSTLVTMILAFCIDMMELVNFNSSMYDKSPLSIEVGYTDSDVAAKLSLSDEQIAKYKEEIYEPKKYILNNIMYMHNSHTDDISIDGKDCYQNLAFVEESCNPFENMENNLIAGRLWNKEDINKNYIWISSNIAMDKQLVVGQSVQVSVRKRNDGEIIVEDIKPVTYVVKGILNTMPVGYNRADYIIGASNMKNLNVSVKKMIFAEPQNLDSDMLKNIQMMQFAKKFNEHDYEKNPTGVEVGSYKAESNVYMLYTTLGVIGGGVLLSLIVILLSIGCVSNSIQITVEQNRKFFGVMKAVGLRDNTVKKIVRYQAVVMIILAVAAASGIGVGVLSAVKPMIFNAMRVSDMNAVAFGLPIYLPFVVFAMLVLLLLTYTRKSLNKISKMDVVSVISEVN